MEASEHKFESLKQLGSSVATSELWDIVIQDLISHNQAHALMWKSLLGWMSAKNDGIEYEEIQSGDLSLSQAFRARVCIECAGKLYE